MCFPIVILSTIVQPPPCAARCVLSCANITYFFSVSVAVGRRFNATSKKKITEGFSIHFVIKRFLKSNPLSFDPRNIYKMNQALKLLLVAAAVELVLYLDLWAMKCSSFIFTVISNAYLRAMKCPSFIFTVISNTISVAERRI